MGLQDFEGKTRDKMSFHHIPHTLFHHTYYFVPWVTSCLFLIAPALGSGQFFSELPCLLVPSRECLSLNTYLVLEPTGCPRLGLHIWVSQSQNQPFPLRTLFLLSEGTISNLVLYVTICVYTKLIQAHTDAFNSRPLPKAWLSIEKKNFGPAKVKYISYLHFRMIERHRLILKKGVRRKRTSCVSLLFYVNIFKSKEEPVPRKKC